VSRRSDKKSLNSVNTGLNLYIRRVIHPALKSTTGSGEK